MKKNSLILLIIFSVFLINLMACAIADKTPFSRERSFEKSYKFPAGGRISLKNENGSIYINAWDKDEVRIYARKYVRAATQEMADKAVKEIKIEVDYQDGNMHIFTHNPYQRKGKDFSDFLAGRNVRVEVTYELNIPKNIEVRAKTMNGKIEVEEVKGRTEVSTMNGKVVIENAQGTVEADTMNGSIEAEIPMADGKDKIKLKTMNGGIRLYLAEDIKANIKATTANGSISSDFAIEKESSSSRRRLRGEINGGGTKIELETMNGSIKILEIL